MSTQELQPPLLKKEAVEHFLIAQAIELMETAAHSGDSNDTQLESLFAVVRFGAQIKSEMQRYDGMVTAETNERIGAMAIKTANLVWGMA